MAFAPKPTAAKLAKMQAVFERLTEEGTGGSAFTALTALCKRENIDLRDLRIVLPTSSGHYADLIERNQKKFEWLEQSIADLQATLDKRDAVIMELRGERTERRWKKLAEANKIIAERDAQIAELHARIAGLESENIKWRTGHAADLLAKGKLPPSERQRLENQIKRLEAELADAKEDAFDALTEQNILAVEWERSKKDAIAEATAALRERIADLETAAGERGDHVVQEVRDAVRDAVAQVEADYEARIAELEAKLPQPDPWRACVEAWLASQRSWRHTTAEILHGACGLPTGMVDVEASRRLAAVIREINATSSTPWVESTNVPDGRGKRVRGYIIQKN